MNTKLLTRFIFSLLLLFYTLPAQTTAPVSSDEPKAFIEDMGRRAIEILANPSKTRAEREETFRQILNQFFDVKAIGKFVLGRQWHALKERGAETTEAYFRLFENEVARSYAIRFEDYRGEKFFVMNARQQGDGWLVSSTVERPEGQVVSVHWILRQTSLGLRVIDVTVEGMSMSVTKRSEYAAIISREGGIEGFLKILQRQYADSPALNGQHLKKSGG